MTHRAAIFQAALLKLVDHVLGQLHGNARPTSRAASACLQRVRAAARAGGRLPGLPANAAFQARAAAHGLTQTPVSRSEGRKASEGNIKAGVEMIGQTRFRRWI